MSRRGDVSLTSCVGQSPAKVWEARERAAGIVYGSMGEESGRAVTREEWRVHRIGGLALLGAYRLTVSQFQHPRWHPAPPL
jgi:hypothetical protein